LHKICVEFVFNLYVFFVRTQLRWALALSGLVSGFRLINIVVVVVISGFLTFVCIYNLAGIN